MANTLSNIPNPLDEMDLEEALEICRVRGIIEEDEADDKYEFWQLKQWIDEVWEDDRIEDYNASFYSY